MPNINIREYDISRCFDDSLMFEHREIKFPLGEDMGIVDLPNIYILEQDLQFLLALHGKVEFLRIQRVEASYNILERTVYVVFSVMAFPFEQVDPIFMKELKREVTIPLHDVIDNIATALNKSEIKFKFILGPDKYILGTADSNYFRTVDRGKDDPGRDTIIKKSYFVGFTGGSMGGLAFGMILLGGLIGCAVYFFVLRNGRTPSLRLSGFSHVWSEKNGKSENGI